MPPPLYAARCSPAPAHTRLTLAAPSAPCAMNIHDRHSTGYDHGVVHINHVVTWTANQSSLVTLIFDLLTLKLVSESCVTWVTSVPILVSSQTSLFSSYARCTRQTDVRQNVRHTSDRRQTKASLKPPPIRGGGITSCAHGDTIRCTPDAAAHLQPIPYACGA